MMIIPRIRGGFGGISNSWMPEMDRSFQLGIQAVRQVVLFQQLFGRLPHLPP